MPPWGQELRLVRSFAGVHQSSANLTLYSRLTLPSAPTVQIPTNPLARRLYRLFSHQPQATGLETGPMTNIGPRQLTRRRPRGIAGNSHHAVHYCRMRMRHTKACNETPKSIVVCERCARCTASHRTHEHDRAHRSRTAQV